MRREAPALLLQQLATLTPLGLTTLLWLRTSGTKQDLPGLSWSDLLLLLAAAGTAGVIYTVKSTASEVLEKAAADPAPAEERQPLEAPLGQPCAGAPHVAAMNMATGGMARSNGSEAMFFDSEVASVHVVLLHRPMGPHPAEPRHGAEPHPAAFDSHAYFEGKKALVGGADTVHVQEGYAAPQHADSHAALRAATAGAGGGPAAPLAGQDGRACDARHTPQPWRRPAGTR